MEKPEATKHFSSKLLSSRLYDLETDLQRLVEILASENIDQANRQAVSGRFYRLLSEQDYELKMLKKLKARLDSPAVYLPMIIDRSCRLEFIKHEVLEFLGG